MDESTGSVCPQCGRHVPDGFYHSCPTFYGQVGYGPTLGTYRSNRDIVLLERIAEAVEKIVDALSREGEDADNLDR